MPVRLGGTVSVAAVTLRAAAFGAALLAVACGDQGANAPAAGAGGATAGEPSAIQAGGSSQGGAGVTMVTGPSGPLDSTGWVMQPPFYGAGDEPAWRLDIVDGWFLFKRSALRAIEEPMTSPVKEGGADVFQAGPMKIVIRSEACQTGGQSSDVAAEVTYDDVTFVGCAFPAPAAGVATSPEANAVVSGVASVDACLAKLAQPALVTGVVSRQDGAMTSVAMRARNGAIYECGAETASGNIQYLDPIEVGAQAPWMSRMRFVREGIATSAPCAEATEVRSGEQVLGRMLDRSCKF
jgi:uncharacterized membrane protein